MYMLNLQPKHEFTVSEISLSLKSMLEKNFSSIKVRGEISGLKVASSGHSYFSLKDEKSVLHATCWRNVFSQLNIKLEEGMEVICTGYISTYPSRSVYQLSVEKVEIAGVGGLLKLLMERKQKLEKEGLFSADRKKKLPFLPKTIAVITSPTGAVIKDIIHRIEDRFPVHIIIWGVAVQGVEAAQQIADGIYGLQDLPENIPKPDVIIVARGGGSIEDLWAFNEEIVVRAVSDSKIPIISAVGHETDTTLIDFASDLRAPTPTAAAEIAVPVLQDLSNLLVQYYNAALSSMRNIYSINVNSVSNCSLRMMSIESVISQQQRNIDDYSVKLNNIMHNKLSSDSNRFGSIASSFSVSNLSYIYGTYISNLKALSEELIKEMELTLFKCENQLSNLDSLLMSYNPDEVLKRGFAIISTEEDEPLTSISSLSVSQLINIKMYDGKASVVVKSKDFNK